MTIAEAMQGGGPAFPTTVYDPVISPIPRESFVTIQGMSLRDYFAAAAMPAILNNTTNLAGLTMNYTDVETYRKAVAEVAYKMADMMLEARKR